MASSQRHDAPTVGATPVPQPTSFSSKAEAVLQQVQQNATDCCTDPDIDHGYTSFRRFTLDGNADIPTDRTNALASPSPDVASDVPATSLQCNGSKNNDGYGTFPAQPSPSRRCMGGLQALSTRAKNGFSKLKRCLCPCLVRKGYQGPVPGLTLKSPTPSLPPLDDLDSDPFDSSSDSDDTVRQGRRYFQVLKNTDTRVTVREIKPKPTRGRQFPSGSRGCSPSIPRSKRRILLIPSKKPRRVLGWAKSVMGPKRLEGPKKNISRYHPYATKSKPTRPDAKSTTINYSRPLSGRRFRSIPSLGSRSDIENPGRKIKKREAPGILVKTAQQKASNKDSLTLVGRKEYELIPSKAPEESSTSENEEEHVMNRRGLQGQMEEDDWRSRIARDEDEENRRSDDGDDSEFGSFRSAETTLHRGDFVIQKSPADTH